MGRPFVGCRVFNGGSRHQGGAWSRSGLPKKIIVTLSHWMTLIQILSKVDMSPAGLGRLRQARLEPEVLRIPGAGRVDVVGEKVDVAEAVVPHRVDLDQLFVGPRNIEVVVVGTRERAERGLNVDAVLSNPFVFGADVDASPADVPDPRVECRIRRRVDLIKEEKRALDEHGLGIAAVFDRNGAEDAAIKGHRLWNVLHVEPHMMKVGRLVGGDGLPGTGKERRGQCDNECSDSLKMVGRSAERPFTPDPSPARGEGRKSADVSAV